MKKLFLLLTIAFSFSSFATNSENTKFTDGEMEDFGTCVYSINTYWSDGSVTTKTYITSTLTERDCELTAQAHVLRLASQ